MPRNLNTEVSTVVFSHDPENFSLLIIPWKFLNIIWWLFQHCLLQSKSFGLNKLTSHLIMDKVALGPRRPTRPELILVSVAWSNWEYCYSPLDGMLVHCRVTLSSMLPVPIYTSGWRRTMWGKVSRLRKQYDGRDWASNHRPSDLKSNALTTTPPRPPKVTFSLRKQW